MEFIFSAKLNLKFVENMDSMDQVLFNHFYKMEAVKIIKIGITQPELA